MVNTKIRLIISFAAKVEKLYAAAAAAAAKSLQSCLTLCNPIDGSPPGSPILGILQARTLEWVAISFSNAIAQEITVLRTLSQELGAEINIFFFTELFTVFVYYA